MKLPRSAPLGRPGSSLSSRAAPVLARALAPTEPRSPPVPQRPPRERRAALAPPAPGHSPAVPGHLTAHGGTRRGPRARPSRRGAPQLPGERCLLALLGPRYLLRLIEDEEETYGAHSPPLPDGTHVFCETRAPSPFFLCLSGVCWKQLHTRHELLKTRRRFWVCFFFFGFFPSPEIITEDKIK